MEISSHSAAATINTLDQRGLSSYRQTFVASWSPGGFYTFNAWSGVDYQQGDIRHVLRHGRMADGFGVSVSVAPRYSRSIEGPDDPAARAKGDVNDVSRSSSSSLRCVYRIARERAGSERQARHGGGGRDDRRLCDGSYGDTRRGSGEREALRHPPWQRQPRRLPRRASRRRSSASRATSTWRRNT